MERQQPLTQELLRPDSDIPSHCVATKLLCIRVTRVSLEFQASGPGQTNQVSTGIFHQKTTIRTIKLEYCRQSKHLMVAAAAGAFGALVWQTN